MSYALSTQAHDLQASLSGQFFFDEDLVSGVVRWRGDPEPLTGDPLEAFEGQGMEVLEARLTPKDLAHLETARMEALQTCSGFEVECWLHWRNSPPRRIQIRARYVGGPGGRPSRCLGVVEDITRLWEARTLLQQTPDKALEAAERTRKTVHDLNNALMVALGNLDLLRLDLARATPTEDHLAMLETALHKSAALVEGWRETHTS